MCRHFHRKDISNSCDVVSPSPHPHEHLDWAREIFRWEHKVLIIRSKLLESQLVKQQRLPAISITLVDIIEKVMKLSRDEVLRRMNKSFHLEYEKTHAFSWIYSKAEEIAFYPEKISSAQISCGFCAIKGYTGCFQSCFFIIDTAYLGKANLSVIEWFSVRV